MRRRLLLAKLSLVVGTGAATAQLPRIPEAPPILPPLPAIPLAPANPAPPAPNFPQQPQLPLPQFPQQPQFPSQPQGQLPPLRPDMPARPTNPGAFPGQPGTPGPATPSPYNPYAPPPLTNPNPVAQPQEITLPQPENKIPLQARDISLKRAHTGWQIWAGQRVLRDFGNDRDSETNARDAFRVYQDLRPTEWATVGTGRVVVEYALSNGRAPVAPATPNDDPRNPNPGLTANGVQTGAGQTATGAGAKLVVPIDLRTVRVEAVRGVWCLRDDDSIHFNFGPVKADAEQALAVVRRYGFNRVGVVGPIEAPVMTYFFVGPEVQHPGGTDKSPLARAGLQAQIDGLQRVGIPVPGVGYVGESVRIDPRKLDVRKDGAEWVVACGAEVLGRFGPTEFAARDAARTLADARFTEFCKVGSAGLTFFLVNGKAPTRVPFAAQGNRFDLASLKVVKYGDKFAVTENGKRLFDCASAEEGETLVRVVKHFGFDQLCHLGPSPKTGVSFLAKGQ